MFKAICIKKYGDFVKGDVVRAWKGFGNNIYFYKGVNIKINISEPEFMAHFTIFRRVYIIEQPPTKKRFQKPRKNFYNADFREVPENLLIEMYRYIFSYIEQTKQINPELILTFSFSIVSTLEKLKQLYKILTPEEFLEAVKSSEQVFLGIYKTALGMEIERELGSEGVKGQFEEFKSDNEILGNFYKELNKKQQS